MPAKEAVLLTGRQFAVGSSPAAASQDAGRAGLRAQGADREAQGPFSAHGFTHTIPGRAAIVASDHSGSPPLARVPGIARVADATHAFGDRRPPVGPLLRWREQRVTNRRTQPFAPARDPIAQPTVDSAHVEALAQVAGARASCLSGQDRTSADSQPR